MELPQLTRALSNLLYPVIGKFSNNSEAIAVEPGPAQGTSVNGLLCVVQRVPAGVASEVTNGKFLDYSWQIRLVQYDRNQSVDKAIRLIQESPLFRVRNLVYVPPTSQSYEQCRIVIWDPSLIKY